MKFIFRVIQCAFAMTGLALSLQGSYMMLFITEKTPADFILLGIGFGIMSSVLGGLLVGRDKEGTSTLSES